MELILTALVTLTIITGILALVFSINGKKMAVQARLESLLDEPQPEFLPPELTQPLRVRLLQPVINFASVFSRKITSGDKKALYEKKLQEAGSPYGLTVEIFLAIKYLLLFLCLVMGVLTRHIIGFILLLFAGIFLPELFLKSQGKKRKEEIVRTLPDILDLLSVSVEAGLGFDAALQKVVEKSDGPLTSEFELTLQEINIGKPRREALRDMADRVGVDDVTLFLGSIIQADQLGVSISNVLRLQARQVRTSRRMRAEETAQKAPIKILIPLLLCIFPTILIVLLGPAVIQMMDSL